MPDAYLLAQYAPNLCFCGHDYTAHLPIGSNICNACNIAGGVGHTHVFASNQDINRTPPASDIRPVGFVTSGGGEVYNPLLTTLAVASVAGASSFTVQAGGTVGMKPGDSVYFFEPANKFRSEWLTVLAVVSGTVFTTTTTALSAHAITVTQISLAGAQGSTQGAAMPANGQRAG